MSIDFTGFDFTGFDFTGYYKSLTDERGRLVRRVVRLEKERDRLYDVLFEVWQRWDSEDTRDRPALALDLALVLGLKASAQSIAQGYGARIVAEYPNYARDVARLLKPSKERK